MNRLSAALVAIGAWLAISPAVCAAQEGSPKEVVLAEKDGLKAVVRLKNPASILANDWLQIEIANGGPAGRIKTLRLEGSSEHGDSFSPNVLSEVALGLPTGRNPDVSIGNTLPEGKFLTSTPGLFAGAGYGLPKADMKVTIQFTLNLELEDGRSLTMAKPGETLAFVWERPGAAQIESLQEQAVGLLTKAMSSASALSRAETATMRMLLTTEETSRTVTLDQALAALKQRQLDGTFRFTEVMSLVFRRWRTDPAVIDFYRESLRLRGPEAVSDLSLFAVSIWDDSLIEPTIQVIEKAARAPVDSLALSRGVELLDRNYASWRLNTAVPTRLSKAVVEINAALNGRSGTAGAFYNFVNLLAMTHDRAMIGVLRPYLTDKTIDPYTSVSANMPHGRTPMRYSELAANGIFRLLGEPIMFDPYKRAAAPQNGPYPEWVEWDKQIAGLQQRLDAMPKP